MFLYLCTQISARIVSRKQQNKKRPRERGLSESEQELAMPASPNQHQELLLAADDFDVYAAVLLTAGCCAVVSNWL
jgi:hypothetical protein